MSTIIDRRLNDRDKSAVNRQRFLRRYKEQIKEHVRRTVAEGPLKKIEAQTSVRVPKKDLQEPRFHHGPGGDREIVHPGNKKFKAGDTIPRPEPEGGEGGTGEGGQGDAQDDFVFELSREEYLTLLFEDLGLPYLVRRSLDGATKWKWRRAGYTPTGVPANLSVPRSLRNALARRIALGAPHKRRLEALALDAALAPARARADVQEEIAREEAALDRIPFIEEIDLRFRNRVRQPVPIAKAVMFCLMDVSASMDEEKKDLAKRFFTLLYLFLLRSYEQVELVFIRHTDDAEEVTEEEFFTGTKSGGTVVLSALVCMEKIRQARFADGKWNVYGAQASDGDAFGDDPIKSSEFLKKNLLPAIEYFTYVDITDDADREKYTKLSMAYAGLDAESDHFAMSKICDKADVYPALRDLFSREHAERTAA